ncbi:MAG: rRNA (guanine527-N7)-methyltransferase [Caballeronia sp.]|jgi:16S rRNA (guanine527-N7)-methyltransferase|nr:rRNA (guanine527-N7)-methyltransferase [Caballeronia sp.]
MQRETGDAGLTTLLNEGIEQLGIAVTAAQRQKLLDYVALLGKWNAVYNLTAIRDPRQMLIQHILDSLAIIPFLTRRTGPQSALDVGSGGGLPGIVMAIVLPEWQVTLNDIVHKKTAFQSQAKLQLGLANLSVVTGRVENLHPGVEVPGLFDVIVSRAFAELSDFVTLARHLVAGNGRIWAMKGIRPDAEIARLPADAKVCCIERLRVPMLDAERHLIEIEIGAAPH